MDFSTIKALTIPEGVVTKITRQDGLVLWSLSASQLPEGYQELEYIFAQKDANAYIDLGFAYDGGATVEIDQYIYDDGTTYIFGAAENRGALRCAFSSPYNGGIVVYGTNGTAYIALDLTYILNGVNKVKVVYTPGAWQGFNYTTNDVSGPSNLLPEYTMTNNLYLFAQNYNGAPRYGGVRQVHHFSYCDKNGKLICELVPCYRKSDGMAGMYDVVRRIFLTNALDNGIYFGRGPEINGDSGDQTYTNLINIAVDDTGEIYYGHGYADGRRWSSSSNAEAVHNLGRLSGWIPYEKLSTYRYKNFYMSTVGYVDGSYIVYKKTDGTTYAVNVTRAGSSTYAVDIDNDLCTFTARLDDVVAFRVSGYMGINPPIITKNEVIPI